MFTHPTAALALAKAHRADLVADARHDALVRAARPVARRSVLGAVYRGARCVAAAARGWADAGTLLEPSVVNRLATGRGDR